jgi:hypothetical protein
LLPCEFQNAPLPTSEAVIDFELLAARLEAAPFQKRAMGRVLSPDYETDFLRTIVVTKKVLPAGDKIEAIVFWPTSDSVVQVWTQEYLSRGKSEFNPGTNSAP